MARAYPSWGTQVEQEARAQMDAATALPVTVAGALMPDAHVGYGLPIGGVLATLGSVIPYAVGMDIACRMMMTVYDAPPAVLTDRRDFYVRAIESNTRFGIGAAWKARRTHPVMEEDRGVTAVTGALREKAASQLGTSGSGNHFVEFVDLTLDEEFAGIPAGRGVAGIIPGSMGTPGVLVEGRGNPDSLASTSHGAGRAMSRTAAAKTFSWKETKAFLARQGVELISAGLDEVPWAYKDITAVMDAQKDLARTVGRFMPRLVKMAPSGERPED